MDKCLCGGKISSNCVIVALNRSWHKKCFELYKIAYVEGFKGIYNNREGFDKIVNKRKTSSAFE